MREQQQQLGITTLDVLWMSVNKHHARRIAQTFQNENAFYGYNENKMKMLTSVTIGLA
jgi:hypothetical protein